jgi:hypothetical protein
MAPVVEIFDWRDRAPALQPKSRIIRGKTVMRDPSTITTVVLHQTACEFGVSAASARANGEELGQRLRTAKVACHALAFREGWVVAMRPLRSFVHHANKANPYSLGLEIEGLYSGLADDPATAPNEARRTVWNMDRWSGPPDELTVETARAALCWLVEQGRAEGMPIEWVDAHRQSSRTRRSDPGEELWKAVVVDYARPKLGLRTRPDFTIGPGRPIPRAWDPTATARY